MKIFKLFTPLVLGLLFIAGSVYAQGQGQPATQPDSITNQELKKFADISTEAQKIQKETREKVDSMLANKDMDMQRLSQIMMSRQNPKMADSVKVTEQEKETMKEIQPELMKINQKSQQKFVAVIKEEGLNPQRFQQIMQAVRSNPEVMKRFQKIANENKPRQQQN